MSRTHKPHKTMIKQSDGVIGHGLVLYFRVENMEPIEKRIKEHSIKTVKPKEFNPISHQYEIIINDPDGYEVVICAYK